MNKDVIICIVLLVLILAYFLYRYLRIHSIKEDEFFHEAWYSILRRWMVFCAKLISIMPTVFMYGYLFHRGDLFTMNGIFEPLAFSLVLYVIVRFIIALIYDKYASIREQK